MTSSAAGAGPPHARRRKVPGRSLRRPGTSVSARHRFVELFGARFQAHRILADRLHMSVSDLRHASVRTLGGGPRPRPSVWAAYGVMGLLLLGYVVLLISEPHRAQSTRIGGWGVGAFELMAGFLCIAAGRHRPTARAAVPVILGASLVVWSLGDLTLTFESIGRATPPVPSLADVLFLSFFPLAYVALVLLISGEVRRLTTPNWLDGSVAGLRSRDPLRCVCLPRDRADHRRERDQGRRQPRLPRRRRSAAAARRCRDGGHVGPAQGAVAPRSPPGSRSTSPATP